MGKKNCVACRKSCKSGAIRVPEDRYYHEKCFACSECKTPLSIAEFYSHDGQCYCQADYKRLFAAKCSFCGELFKGDEERAMALNKYWHPSCFKCALCNRQMKAGEKVTYDGKVFSCFQCKGQPTGPKVTSTPMKPMLGDVTPVAASPIGGKEVNNIVKDDYTMIMNEATQQEPEVLPPRADNPEIEAERKAGSEALASRKIVFGKFYNQSYLKIDAKKVEKGPPQNFHSKNLYQHFHRPENFSYKNVRKDFQAPRQNSDFLLRIQDKKKRESRPAMNNEEAIKLAKCPDGDPESYVPPIERVDWPCPTAQAVLRNSEPRVRSSSAGSKSNRSALSDDEDTKYTKSLDSSREVAFLRRYGQSSSVGRALLKSFEKEERLKKQRAEDDPEEELDPVSASRTPSANKEPPFRTRYESHKFASPSRDLEYRPRSSSLDERPSGYGRGRYIVSSKSPPKPGYSLKSSTHPSSAMSNGTSKFSRSLEWERASLSEYDPETGLRRVPRFRITPGISLKSSAYTSIRRSLPSMLRPDQGQAKIYPYEQLKLTNHSLPPGVDRLNLEEHLSKEEFESIFHLGHEEFYRLAEWKRNDMKMRVHLFECPT